MLKYRYYNEDLGWYEKVTFPYPGDKELFQMCFSSFKETETLLDSKIEEYQEEKQKIREELKPLLGRINDMGDGLSKKFWRQMLKVIYPTTRLREIVLHINRLKRLKNIARVVFKENKNFIDTNYEATLDLARGAQILDVVSPILHLKKTGNKYVGLCPFHEERVPSLYIYPNTNSFYCFGCCKGGDVIKFVQLYFGYDFKQAVQYLTGGRK